MANEYTVSESLTCSKGGMTIKASHTFRVDMTGNNMMDTTQDVGTSAEALELGPISGVPPVLYVQNLGTTNYVLVGFTNPPTEIRLNAGESARFRPTTATIYLLANTAAVRVRVWAGEP